MENAHLATASLSKLVGQYGELVNSSSRFVVNSWNLLQAAHQNDHNISSSSPSSSSSTNAFLSLPSQFLAVLANNVLTIVKANRGMTPLDYLFCLMIIVLGSISLVLLRKVTDYVFVQRILVQNGLIPLRSTNRISESLFTLIIYSTTYTLANRIVQQRQFVDHPELIWKDYSLASTIPFSIQLVYCLEISYYFYSLYATYFMNAWRKDSLVLMIHHVVALVLLTVSMGCKAHNIGIVILYQHDVADVVMEVATILIKLQLQKLPLVEFLVHQIACNSGFALFSGLWFYYRLYQFPLLSIQTSVSYLSASPERMFPFSFLLFSLLWVIQAMNLYWAWLIVMMATSLIVNKSNKVDDVRDIVKQPQGGDPDQNHHNSVTSNGHNNNHHHEDHVKTKHE